jgi:cysteine synthase
MSCMKSRYPHSFDSSKSIVNRELSLSDLVSPVVTESSSSQERRLSTEEGIFCGISSGAAVVAPPFKSEAKRLPC